MPYAYSPDPPIISFFRASNPEALFFLLSGSGLVEKIIMKVQAEYLKAHVR